MDINLNDDQRMLQDTTRRFMEERSPIVALRRLVENENDFDRDVWLKGAALGWTALFVPEAYGGIAELGQGVMDASIIAEEMGRVVYSGPFLGSNLVAFALAAAGSDAQRQAILPGLAAGELLAAWCVSGWGAQSGIEPGGVRVTRSGDRFVLDGVAACVDGAPAADQLLVTAASDGGALSQFLIAADTPGIDIVRLDSVDLGRSLAEVRFAHVDLGAEMLVGATGGAADQVERQFQVAIALQCAETVGVIGRVFEFTLDWVKERLAFGRPIGAFQALKHRLADHAAQFEGAKAAAAYAALAVQGQTPDAAIAVSVAKSHCGRYGTEILRDCLHMHGGIGMTWEHDIHLYLRRVVSNEALWGTPAAHHQRLCTLAGL